MNTLYDKAQFDAEAVSYEKSIPYIVVLNKKKLHSFQEWFNKKKKKLSASWVMLHTWI